MKNWIRPSHGWRTPPPWLYKSSVIDLATILDYALAALAIAAVFSALVFVHEWGHYAVARLAGVRVEAFSIGFGPELCGWSDRHGTRWKVCAVPLGGYVKMFGDTDAASAGKDTSLTPEEQKDTFYAKPLWKRALVIAAGPGVNYLFAFVLLAGLYATVGKPMAPPVAAGVMAGSVAEEIGIAPGDAVVAIDGRPMHSFDDITRVMLLARGEAKRLTVHRGDQVLYLTAAPKVEEHEDDMGFATSRARLGLLGPQGAFKMDKVEVIDGDGPVCDRLGQEVRLRVAGEEDVFILRPTVAGNPDCATAEILYVTDKDGMEPVRLGPVQALAAAGARVWAVNATILASFGQIFTGERSPRELGGVIRIGAVISDMVEGGLPALIALTAFLSVTLGLINLFPIPVLDGGHLVFYAIEAVLGRPVPEKVQDWAFQAGFVFLIGVMLFTNLNDIVQLIW